MGEVGGEPESGEVVLPVIVSVIFTRELFPSIHFYWDAIGYH